MIAPAVVPRIGPQDQIFVEFGDYLIRERGLAPKTIIRHLPVIRRFLREVCPAGASDLEKIGQEDVTRYIERHARDWSPASGQAMCWSLRAFLRYLHHAGLSPLALAGCVPSIRRWKLASLPTYLSAAQVQEVLDACDRTTALGRRDYAIVMMLARLGLRADEVATLTWMISTGSPARCSFVPRVGNERRCRCLRTSAQLSSPTCVMAARRRRVAGYFCARWRRTWALHPVARSR